MDQVKGQSEVQRDLASLANVVGRLDAQVGNLSTQVGSLSARFDEQVGSVGAVTATIGRADWKTVAAVAAMLVGMWQFAIRPVETSVEKLDQRETLGTKAFQDYVSTHDRTVYGINAQHTEAIKALQDSMPTGRLATLEAQVKVINDTLSRQWEEMIKNAETRGALTRTPDKGPDQ